VLTFVAHRVQSRETTHYFQQQVFFFAFFFSEDGVLDHLFGIFINEEIYNCSHSWQTEMKIVGYQTFCAVNVTSVTEGDMCRAKLIIFIFCWLMCTEQQWLSLILYNMVYMKVHRLLIILRKSALILVVFCKVVYTELNFMQITVFADVIDPVSGQTVTTNSFHFTYKTPADVVRIIPRSYSGKWEQLRASCSWSIMLSGNRGLVPRV